MLMVAPSGRTNAATSFGTPRLPSATFIVTGRVAALDEVENATSCAGATPRKKSRARSGVSSLSSSGYVTVTCTSRPARTATQ